MRLADSDKRQLKGWLVGKLAAISSAEPSVLADYVVALVTGDTPKAELRSKCNDSLSEILGNQTASFVSTLLAALDNGSYRERGQGGDDARGSSRRDEGDEAYDSNDDRDTHHRRRGRSEDDGDRRRHRESRSRSRDRERERDRERDRERERDRDRNRGRERHGERDDRGGGRRRDDARDGREGREGARRRDQPSQMPQMPPMPQMPQMPFMPFPPPPIPPAGGPHQGRGRGGAGGNGGGNQHGMPPGFDPRAMPPEAFMFPSPDMMLPPGMMPPPGFGMPPMMMGPGFGMMPPGMEGMMGMGPGRDNKRRRMQQQPGAAGAGGDGQQESPNDGAVALTDSAKCTVRCKGIPQNVTAAQIARHFAQFGKIVTTQLNPGEERGGKAYSEALIQFVSPESARKSVSSPLPVLNNRFIKVMLADHNIVDPSTVDESSIEPIPGAEGGEYMAEPKYADDSQRKSGPSFAQTRTLKQYEQLKQLRQREEDIAKQKEQLLQAQIDQYQAIVDKIKKAKPQLTDDSEELQPYVSKVQQLQEQLTRLREGQEEEEDAEEQFYGGRGGRGRGRGGRAAMAVRGRGRAVRGRGRGGRIGLAGQSIDNRPRTIVITSPPDSFVPELAKSHFERFGEVEEVSKQGDQLLVRFANRHSGEIALKSGTFYQGGHLSAGWHQGPPPPQQQQHGGAGASFNGDTSFQEPSSTGHDDSTPDKTDSDSRRPSKYQGVLADVLGGPDEEEFEDEV